MIVEDTQLSLAIGKKGQNVRLASKLIGWNIDIKSEEEKRQEIEAQMTALTAPGTPLTELAGVGPKTIEKMEAAGITTIEKLADMTPEQLIEIPGIGEKMVEKIYQAVNRFYEVVAKLLLREKVPKLQPKANRWQEGAEESSEGVLAAETPGEEAAAEPEAPAETEQCCL